MDSVSIVLGISGTHVRQAMRTAWKSLMQQVSPISASQFGIESRSSLSHSHSGTKLLAFQTEPCEILKLRWAVAGSGTAQLLLTKN